MKTTLLIAAVLLSLPGMAQQKTFKDWTDSSRYYMYKSGKELIRYDKEFKTGMVCTFSGLLLTTIGASVSAQSKTANSSAGLFIAGGILEFLGLYFSIDAPKHVRFAGMYLKGKDIVIPLN